jgi:light-harvesting complex 1 beta chain
MADKDGSWTGLTDAEAEEFHKYYLQGAFLFTGVAVVAHLLAWMWRPWIPGPKGYAQSLIDGAQTVVSMLV